MSTPKTAIIVMSALVPTLGHKYLVEFARHFVGPFGSVDLLLCTLPSEPVDPIKRFSAFVRAFDKTNVNVKLCEDEMPQNPEDHANFWELWKEKIESLLSKKIGPEHYVIASETYGIKLAEVLGCKFIPCNIYRQVVPTKGTNVRYDLRGQFHMIMPEFQQYMVSTITLFGADSTGKTTMAKRLAKELNGHFVPEWAREYLETCGTEVTEEKMMHIVEAQYASQMAVKNILRDKPYIFQDTDLLSTVGYYPLFGMDAPEEAWSAYRATKSDLYIVMNDQIPFEPDQLRYGVDKRESTTQHWIDLLEENDCDYLIVPHGTHEEQFVYITNYLNAWYYSVTQEIVEYMR